MMQPHTYKGKVSAAGRVVIPVELRRELGWEPEQEIIFSRDEFGVRMMTLDQAIHNAQALFRTYIKEGDALEDLRVLRRQESGLD